MSWTPLGSPIGRQIYEHDDDLSVAYLHMSGDHWLCLHKLRRSFAWAVLRQVASGSAKSHAISDHPEAALRGGTRARGEPHIVLQSEISRTGPDRPWHTGF